LNNEFSWKEDSSVPIGWSLTYVSRVACVRRRSLPSAA